MKRHARRMRRNGLQPMVVIDSNDQLPDIVAVVVARGLWRYRSELAPIALALAAMITALVLHRTHPGWWIGLLIAATGVSSLLALVGDRIGLSLRVERLYAAAVTMSVGTWVAAATAIGVTCRPLPQILLVATPVLAVPWWAHRRRRARVRVERTLAAWPDISKSVGLPGSRVMSAMVDMWGWRARFGLARGQTIQDVIGKIPALESALGTFRGAVRIYPTRDDKANRFELRVLNIDPHANSIPWPGPSVATITEPIDLGPFEDASPARVLLLRRHTLIGGIAGSGKSGGINVLMGNLSACRDVVIWAIDLKRGMELQPWAPCIDRLATTPQQACALLRDAVAILEARADFLTSTGRRVWEPSARMPALVIIIDEYAELADDAPEAATFTDSIARRGRAVAVTLVAATQRPTQKAMGKGAVRSQMDVRMSFRVRERKDVDLILGQGMLSAGWHAHTLNAPGKFLLSAPEHDIPRRARAFLLSDQAVSDAVRGHAHNRPTLDEVSRRAPEEAVTLVSPDAPERGVERLLDEPEVLDGSADEESPEAALWAMLVAAPDEGVPVPLLIQASGKSRRWVYYQLNGLAESGRAIQVTRGRWRAVTPETGDSP
ncbi:FtsK/SpoIIIE domain-containing protein [Actinomadura opuntiae]|uniref:FtsK/SpoIIIE domain-containing protein n=1 Tax=Actinomadura sp. OS1-43 TaxID=604315 RepID=UPI00255AD9FF|nr:FtsK/SpoIIIE domain-containing protein [Actinomadura sp. OS1-43]MDL4817760.1 cell division protein FtsK [Actinomadura sp. OS1-43]